MLKKISYIILICILSSDVAYSQKIEICGINFFQALEIQEQSGLNISVSSFLLDSNKCVHFYPKLKYWLEFNDKTVFSEQTSLDFFFGDSTQNTCFIPFENIKLEDGKYELTLKVLAFQGDEILSDTFSLNFIFFQPKLYDYQDQQIKIQHLSVQRKKYYGVSGLVYEAHLKFRFPSAYIRGISTDEQKAYYYIEPEILHSEYVQILDTTSVIKFRKRVTVPINYLVQQVEIFVPFSEINLPIEQKYFIYASLKLSSEDENWNFIPVKRSDFSFYFPALRYFYVDVSNIEVAFATNYDPQSALGQIFSKSTKNKGKGYPDPYWLLKQGNRVIFNTDNFFNTFRAPDGTAEFKVASGDKLLLQVMDYDAIGEDDVIGGKEINTLENDSENVNFKMGNVNNIHLSILTKLYPKINIHTLNYVSERQAGVPGLRIVPKKSLVQDDFFKISRIVSIDTLKFNLDSPSTSIFIPYNKDNKKMTLLLRYGVQACDYHFTIRKIINTK